MSDNSDPITDSLLVFTKYFTEKQIPYVIVGGVAVLVFGRARMTLDIDIIVDHTQIDREDFVLFLTQNGFDASLSDLAGFDDHTHCTFFLRHGMFRIDMKGVYSQYEKESIEMAIESVFNKVKIQVDHPSNIILHKLRFGSEQDYEDALAVYTRMSDIIDNESLLQRANSMGLKPILTAFLTEVNEIINKIQEEI